MFSHDLNEVWHRKVHDVVPPGGLQHHVGPQEVIAREQACSKTFLLVLLQEPGQQLLGQLGVLRLCRVLHGVLQGAHSGLGKVNLITLWHQK